MKFQYVLRLLPCIHHDDIQLRTKHFALKADRFLQSLSVFCPSGCSGLQALVERKTHLSHSHTGKSRGGSHLEIAEARKWTPPPSADPSIRQLPIQETCHLIVDVWWRSVTLKNNIWFVRSSWGINHSSIMSR